MEIKKETTQTATVETAETKASKISNRRVRFSRLVLNFFLKMFRKEIKNVTIDEVSLDGIFSRIEKEKEKEKEKVRKVIEKQVAAIGELDEVAKKETEKVDEEVAKLEKEIAEAKEKLQAKVAGSESEKAKIAAEKIRGEKIMTNISKFYGETE